MSVAPPPPTGSPWGSGRGPLALQLGLSTFGILALELTLIRWMAGQIRLVAYFANLILMAAFLGMGLGVALGKRRPQLVHAALPALALLSGVLAFSGPLHLMYLRFPDPSISLWGADESAGLLGFIGVTLVVLGCFWAVAGIFLLAATPLGWLFGQLAPLRAYTADLVGSLLGVVAMAAVAALGTPPWIWLTLGILPLLWLSRRPLSIACGLIALGLALHSGAGARFSPYNRIDMYAVDALQQPSPGAHDWRISVNRDFHQYIVGLSDEEVRAAPPGSELPLARKSYDLPFALPTHKGRALVVGAGTGNDVAAALRANFGQVVAVDIDPGLIRLGRALHPDHPYQDPRVQPVVNDARAYFEQNPGERFDVIAYGLLDSHAMFSAMSTLRLDNYVYTVEGLRAAWQHLEPDGVLSVSFSVFAGQWIAERMRATLRAATGLEPVIVFHGYHSGATFLVGRNLNTAAIPADLPQVELDTPAAPVRVPTDDWPYLYLRPGTVPYAYLAVIALILITGALAVRGAYGPNLFRAGGFHRPLFALGAAFMLLETRLVTELSLLFGSTWLVNASVFAGILAMVLLANLWVLRRPPSRLEPYFLLLLITLVATAAGGRAALAQLPLVPRVVLAGLVYATPVAFAGVIFSTLLRQAPDASAALGANLLGSVVGGCLEYASMYLGLRSMAGLALLFYCLALWALRRGSAADPALQAEGG